MDVEDAVRERLEELGLDDAHEAREDDGVDPGVLEDLDAVLFRGVRELRLPRRAVEELARDVVLARTVQDLRVREVREHDLDLRVERARFDRVDDGLHVRAGTRPQNAQMKLCHDRLLNPCKLPFPQPQPTSFRGYRQKTHPRGTCSRPHPS